MEPLTLLAAALIAGHGALEEAGKDTYESLKAVVRRCFIGDEKAEQALAGHDEDPDTYEKPLMKALERNKVHDDVEAVKLAARVLEARDPAGAKQGKYNVSIIAGKGIIVGDQNTVTMNFNGAE